MMNKTLLLLISLSFLAINSSWAGPPRAAGYYSFCSLKGAIYDEAKGKKEEEGEKKKKGGEEEPDCE
jgi:hypothetical protein